MAKKTADEDKTGIKGAQLNNTNAVTWTEAKAMDLAIELLEWYKEESKEGQSRIFFQEFLLGKDIYADVVAYLSGKYPSFSEVIKRAKQWQELRLIKWGTYNKTNTAVTIFMLKNHHGYRDEYGLRHSAQRAGTDELDEPTLDTEISQLMTTMDIETVEVIEQLEAKELKQ